MAQFERHSRSLQSNFLTTETESRQFPSAPQFVHNRQLQPLGVTSCSKWHHDMINIAGASYLPQFLVRRPRRRES
jgi:hypothetical protein